jgi:eukaryotic translation initiation factor 2C
MGYRKEAEKVANPAPKRIIFYRGESCPFIIRLKWLTMYTDGVSEGQFKQVLDLELPRLKGPS